MALFDQNRFRALASAFMLSAVLTGCGGGGGAAPNPTFTSGTQNQAQITNLLSAGGGNDAVDIAGDTVSDIGGGETGLAFEGFLDGLGGDDEVRLVGGGRVASIAFSTATPTSGELHLQRYEIITIIGGMVDGTIDASAAGAGVTFNLRSGRVGPTTGTTGSTIAITGSPQNDIFIISGDLTGDTPALDINGAIVGGGGTADEVRLVAGGVVSNINFSAFTAGELNLQDVEVITIDGGTVNNNISTTGFSAAVTFNLTSGTITGGVLGTSQADIFNLESGTITGDVNGGGGADSFVIGAGITIGGTIDGGGADADTLSLATGFTPTAANLFGGVLTLTLNGGGSLALTLANIATENINVGTLTLTMMMLPAPGGGDPMTPTTLTFTGTAEADTFAITTDITDPTQRQLESVIDGLTGTDVLELNAGAVVASIAFSSDAPTGGDVHLQSVETITINGGMVTGNITGPATATTFNLTSGTVGGNITGGIGADIFTLSGGSVTGNIDGGAGNDMFTWSGGTVGGYIDGGTGADTFTASAAVNVRVTTDDTDTTANAIRLRNVENITLSGANDTLNLLSGSVTGDIDTGRGNDEVTVTSGVTFGDGGIRSGGGSNTFVWGAGLTAGDVTLSGVTINLPGEHGVPNPAGFQTLVPDGGTIASYTANTSSNIFEMRSGMVTGNVNSRGGNDTITLSGGTVGGSVDGGTANDTITLSGGTVGGSVLGGSGNDIITISGGTVTENVIGGQDNDEITVTGGVTLGGSIDGSAGEDRFVWGTGLTTTGVTVTSTAFTLAGTNHGGTGNTLPNPTNFEIFVLGGGTIGGYTGSAENNVLELRSGSVTGEINTVAGSDTITLSGGTVGGNINGGSGNDAFTWSGSAVTGYIDGGAEDSGGADTFTATAAVNVRVTTTADTTANAIRLRNVETITLSDQADTLAMLSGSVGNINTGAGNDTITLSGGTVDVNIEGGTNNDTFILSGGTVTGNVLGNFGNDVFIFTVGSTTMISGRIDGGDDMDTLQYEGAVASTADVITFAAAFGLSVDPDITDTGGRVRNFESQAPTTTSSLGAGLRGAFGIEVLSLSPALNLYGAMSDALMQFGQQTAQGFALADLNLATGRATSLVSKDSPYTKGRIWAHKITHSGNGKGSIGLNLTGLTARADSDYDYEMSLTQHGFDAPLATTRLGAFSLRAVSHTMTGVIETNVAEANVSGYGAGVALMWRGGAAASKANASAHHSASAHHHGLSAHITSLAGAYEVEAHTSPLNPRAVVSEITEGSFSAVNAVISAGVADTRKLGHSLVLRTTADLVWQTLSLDDFSETGPDGIAINFDKATRFTARIGAGLEGEHWFSDVAFVHETSSGGTLSSGLRQDYRQDDGTAIEMKLGGKLADLATGLTLKAYAGLRTSLIRSDSIDPSAHLALNWRF